MSIEEDYWKYSLEVFKTLTAPFRPEPAEITLMEQAVHKHCKAHFAAESVQALVLGVTEEIVGMEWPQGAQLTAVDQSRAMIDAFWPGDSPGQRRLVEGDWLHFPAEPHSFHFALGDAVFNIPDYPEGYAALSRRLASLLHPEGLLVVRVWTQPDPRERTEDVVAEIMERERYDYWSMRFRFVSSLQVDVHEGVWGGPLLTNRYLAEHGISQEAFVAKTEYQPIPLPAVLPEGLEGLRVSYPTLEQFIQAVSAEFRVVDIGYGEHELARRTPVVCLVPLI